MINNAFVSVLMGSDSDWDTMEICIATLKEFKVPYQVHILSAHRSPIKTAEYVKKSEQQGCVVFITGAGYANHLTGLTAAYTTKPVIGIPLVAKGSLLGGLDSFLSTSQMPAGTPVACTSIGSAGAKNAAILAVEILALLDSRLAKALQQQRIDKQLELEKADQKLQQKNDN